MDTFSERLRYARDMRGLTTLALGSRCGVRPETITRLENGHATNPTTNTVKGLAEGLAVNPAWLLYGEGDMDLGEVLSPTGTEGQ